MEKQEKMQENPRGSKMLQEDEKRGLRRPKDTLQVINLQEISMGESLNFELSFLKICVLPFILG